MSKAGRQQVFPVRKFSATRSLRSQRIARHRDLLKKAKLLGFARLFDLGATGRVSIAVRRNFEPSAFGSLDLERYFGRLPGIGVTPEFLQAIYLLLRESDDTPN